jgi:hypothetical protein
VRRSGTNTLLHLAQRRSAARHEKANPQKGVTLGHELLALHHRLMLDSSLHGRRKTERASQLIITPHGVTRSPHVA